MFVFYLLLYERERAKKKEKRVRKREGERNVVCQQREVGTISLRKKQQRFLSPAHCHSRERHDHACNMHSLHFFSSAARE